ncbi:MAG: PQQ-dependent sugar dehydrogenase [Pirellulales bacterium]|nr:PQQ-dependent sugar dehydrogenase [Pirellulales bacterium]
MPSQSQQPSEGNSPALHYQLSSGKIPGLRAPRLNRRLIRYALGMVLFGLAMAYVFWPRHGIWSRDENETVELPLSPPSETLWAAENAFPNVTFFEPTAVLPANDGTGRLFVLERRGTIQVIQDDPGTTSKSLFLDVFDSIDREPYEDDGALGMVLHPEFGQAESAHAGEFFVWYTARADDQRRDRLARFTVPPGKQTADPSSREILIDQADQNIWHNGGALAFGPDGFLYVGVGDEGGNEPDEYENGQRINRKLFSGILRIDVDRRGAAVSHPPRKQPVDGVTSGYDIPNDNPFAGVPGALEEFWAIGLRNPHRMAFDPVTGQLWIGDVGQQHREEVNIAFSGSNHQWSYAEGGLAREETYLHGKRPDPFYGVEAPPVWDYPHLHGDNCVIGGFVYRGSRFPELVGKYIYGDNGSGRIWALEHDGQHVVSNVELLNLPVASKTGLASFGLDTRGEPLIVVLGDANKEDGVIFRLTRGDAEISSPLPKLLSQTGLFEDTASLTPSLGVYPYGVNSPLWSDGAKKRRWIMLPGNGEDPDVETDRVAYSSFGNWRFPPGTVFIKHFDLPTDARNPHELRKLETRILVRDSLDGVYGMTYVWNEQQTDAELIDDGYFEDIEVTTADGKTVNQQWFYPGRATCMVCHTKQAGYVLGVNTRQLNGDYAYPGFGVFSTKVIENQLKAWNHAGLFTRELTESELTGAQRLSPLDDVSTPLEHRVMSYLDANCSHCHRPGGVRANFDARFVTPLAEKRLLGIKPLTPMGPDSLLVRPGDPSRSLLIRRLLDGAKPMPTVGVMHRDMAAVGVISRWIDSLPIPPDLAPVQWSPTTEDDPATQLDSTGKRNQLGR